MKTKFIYFALYILMAPGLAVAVPCSRINLTKCLDSACAINLTSNPAARCQYCGTADAGEPAASAMKSISAGAASKNTISAKELKGAPTDPGERYVWATKLCLTKVQNCSTEDVSEAYDPLIEKSCTAAGVASKAASLQKKAAKNKRTQSSCQDEVFTCVTADEKCTGDFSKCADDSQFDSFLATCLSTVTGCADFTSQVRDTVAQSRTNAISATDNILDAVVAAHKTAREQQMTSIKSGCKDNSDFDLCVSVACKNNTNNNCATDAEKTIANALCQFYKTACTKVK